MYSSWKPLATAWTIGLIGGLFVCALRLTRLVRVEGLENLRALIKQKNGFVLIHRHPSMRETVIIPLLFFPYFLWNPKRTPVITPDARKYYERWWFSVLRPISIPVPREENMGAMRALLCMCRVVQEGRALVLAPEGGRTYKGGEFKFLLPCRCIKIVPRPLGGIDVSMRVIRRFKRGLEKICATNTFVLPVWVQPDGKWRMTIIIGKPVQPAAQEGESLVESLENLLLRTAL